MKTFILTLLLCCPGWALLDSNKDTKRDAAKLKVFIGKYFPSIKESVGKIKPTHIIKSGSMTIYYYKDPNSNCQLFFITNEFLTVVDVMETGKCFSN